MFIDSTTDFLKYYYKWDPAKNNNNNPPLWLILHLHFMIDTYIWLQIAFFKC